jgi:S1-C subfamily serine protease
MPRHEKAERMLSPCHADRRAALSAVVVCLVAGAAACTPQLGPGSESVPATVGDTSAAAPAQPDERAAYVAQVLTRPVPPALQGLREVGVGTGFYVAPDELVTNFHVAGRCVAVTTGNGTEGAETVAQLLAGDPEDDLALLKVDAAGVPATFETELYTEQGLDLAITGYPAHGLAVRLAELSPVTATQANLLADRPNYPFHGEVHPGNSGSPVLDDSGAVIGVVVKKIDTVAVYQRTGEVVDDISIAIANRVVLAFLTANHVPVKQAVPSEPLTRDRLLDKAHGFVRQIGCWR